MKQHVIATLVMTSIALSAPVSATESIDMVDHTERSHNEELIGVGSGVVVGALAGGPVGAIIGALAGGLLGKSVGDDDEIKIQQELLASKNTQLVELNEQNQSLVALSAQYEVAQQQLTELKMAQEQKLTELALGLNVQFKTGSSSIEPHFALQLDDVAYAMSLSPELTLDLTGYADRRGDNDYNQALSEQRVAEVTNYLVEQGVSSERLHHQAYGASSPLTAEQSFENDFFDRRVTLKLQSHDQALAANPAR
ncbi:sortase-associated OmpA-like protein PdsO [Shewanella youngdeokensis]|uniref:Sortase-associated OmpA-like protein PdsO n=1 Tax=Shewanella youngdeokensis TaxID=2999068 RepID=A0ABZ0K1Y7_9GAMM|nr:sortase-associated OmpA-like protein PdsO [Shewanella sp. DAU334]